MTLGSHQRPVGKNQSHLTPLPLLQKLGCFDLDPCAADPRPWDCARINWAERDDGLSRPWPPDQRIFLNPPFDRRTVATWVARLAMHGNGVALLHARLETMWFAQCWERASAILFLTTRLKFCRPDGSTQPFNSGAPAVLVAFGERNAECLAHSGLAGVLVREWTRQPWKTSTQDVLSLEVGTLTIISSGGNECRTIRN
jgi:DNA N-6-adenine-methyltransferase (Dam)